MIASKLFKMPQLKEAVLKISSLRDCIVFDQNYDSNENIGEKSLYERLGKIEGLTKIL